MLNTLVKSMKAKVRANKLFTKFLFLNYLCIFGGTKRIIMIDINKKYRTRDGREVRVYANDGGWDTPVHGAIKCGEEWNISSWNKDGKYSRYGESEYDLIEYDPSDELLEEAKRRFAGDPEIISAYHNRAKILSESIYIKPTGSIFAKTKDVNNDVCIYNAHCDKWAEIIDQRKEHTKEQLEEILGYKFTLKI